jgi:hypothetical protein
MHSPLFLCWQCRTGCFLYLSKIPVFPRLPPLQYEYISEQRLDLRRNCRLYNTWRYELLIYVKPAKKLTSFHGIKKNTRGPTKATDRPCAESMEYKHHLRTPFHDHFLQPCRPSPSCLYLPSSFQNYILGAHVSSFLATCDKSMSRACNKHGREKESIQGFYKKTWRKPH